MSKITSKTIKNIKKGDLIVLQGEGNRDNIIAGIITKINTFDTIFSDNNKILKNPATRYIIYLNDYSAYTDTNKAIKMNENTLVKRLVKYVPAEMLAA